MKHYELLKLVPGADPVEIQEKLWRGYRKLGDALDWLNHPVVHRRCRQEDDFDLMIMVRIEEEERIGELIVEKDKVDPSLTRIVCNEVAKESDLPEWLRS